MFYVNKNTMKEVYKEYKQSKVNKRFEISNEGNLKVNGVLIDLSKYHGVYKQVHSFYVHRMVAETFLENPDNLPYVDHIDGNRYNNHVSNLRWCTPRQNRLNPITVERYNKTIKSEDVHKKSSSSHKKYIEEHPEGTHFHKGHTPWNKLS